MDLTLFEALTGGAFDRLNWQYSGEFDQNFFQKVKCPGGGWAVLELTGALLRAIEVRVLRHELPSTHSFSANSAAR